MSNYDKAEFVKNGFTQIGFAIDNLSSAQIPYLAISRSNQWLAKNFGTDINIFFENNFIPCISPNFPRFNLREAMFFKGHLISTSSKMAHSVAECGKAKHYFYINDLEYLRRNFDPTRWESVMNNDKITKFVRTKDYYDELTNKGYKINPRVVEDFDIDSIMEIVNAR